MTSPAMTGDPSDEEIRSAITGIVNAAHRENYLTIGERTRISRELFYSVRRLDILQDLVDDPDVVEIMVNGPDRIFVEKGGVLQRLPRGFSSPEKLDDVIQQIAGRCNRVINERSPIVDARLSDGSRVNAVISPAALNGPILTIRRFPKEPITMDKLIRLGSLTEEAALFLEDLVRAGLTPGPEFAEALSAADHVVLAPIYAAREKDIYGVSSDDVAREIAALGTDVRSFGTFKEIEEYVRAQCSDGDLLITMGAGNVTNIGPELID